MSEKKMTAVSFAALLCTVLVLLAYCAAFSIEAEDAHAENKLLRERVQELEARPLTIELVREEPEGAAWQSVGECTISHYCGCSECCGKSNCVTATGTLADDEILLLCIGGVYYYIHDILLRMLTPRELYAAMGFPPDYVIDHDYKGNEYGRGKQVARCGNAVCPPMAEAVVRANYVACDIKLTTMMALERMVAV